MQIGSGSEREGYIRRRRPRNGGSASHPKPQMSFNGAVNQQLQLTQQKKQLDQRAAGSAPGMSFNGAIEQQRQQQQQHDQMEALSTSQGGAPPMAFNSAINQQQQMLQQQQQMEALNNLYLLSQQQAQELGQAQGLGGSQQANLVAQLAMSQSQNAPSFSRLA